MLFDRLCTAVERHLTDFRAPVEDAALIEFEDAAHTFLPQKGHWPEDTVAFQKEHFFLPFPSVAIEDPASVVVLFDFHEAVHGLTERRGFIECAPAMPNPEAYGDGHHKQTEETMALAHAFTAAGVDLSNSWAINVGWIKIHDLTTEGMRIEGDARHFFMEGKDSMRDVTDTMTPDIKSACTQSSLINAKTALEEIVYFNDPQHFVIESTPAKKRTKPSKQGKRIQRSPTRPRYTLVAPHKVAELFDTPERVKSGTKEPHPRRRHFRTLKSDHWKNKKGQTVIVSATWVGPEEAVKNGRRYKVRLDL